MIELDAQAVAKAMGRKTVREKSLSKPKVQKTFRENMSSTPVIQGKIDDLHAALKRDGFVHAKFRNLNAFSVRDSKNIAAALMVHFGELAPVPNTRAVVWDIKPSRKEPTRGDDAGDVVSDRTGEARFHTDGAGRENPETAFGLFCLHPASDGGESILVDTQDVIRYLSTHHASVYKRLSTKPLTWEIGESRIYRCLFWNSHAAETRVAYRPDAISRDRDLVDGETLDALDVFEDLIEQKQFHTTMRLNEGEFIIVDNYRVLHARSHFSDRKRHLLRVRVA